MDILKINDLAVTAGKKEILKGIDLTLREGETIALLGPNGHGKSTLLQTIMGNPAYRLDRGSIIFRDQILNDLPVNERARLGLFLGMQNPAEVPGVNNADFLKAALKAVSGQPVPLFSFYRKIDKAYARVKIPFEMSLRNLNEGFSGGEKKKNEILQMIVLDPRLIMLDEIDSGLDVDALQTVAGIIKAEQQAGKSFLIVSHYARLYHDLKVDRTLIIVNGRIVLSGGRELIEKVDREGYGWLTSEHGISLVREEDVDEGAPIGVCATKELLNKKR